MCHFCSLRRVTDGHQWADQRPGPGRNPLPWLSHLRHEGSLSRDRRSSSAQRAGSKSPLLLHPARNVYPIAQTSSQVIVTCDCHILKDSQILPSYWVIEGYHEIDSGCCVTVLEWKTAGFWGPLVGFVLSPHVLHCQNYINFFGPFSFPWKPVCLISAGLFWCSYALSKESDEGAIYFLISTMISLTFCFSETKLGT